MLKGQYNAYTALATAKLTSFSFFCWRTKTHISESENAYFRERRRIFQRTKTQNKNKNAKKKQKKKKKNRKTKNGKGKQL